MLELLPGKVSVENEVVLGTTGTRDLKGDVFRPPVEGQGRPGVLIIHGGGWYQGDRSQLRYYGIQLGRHQGGKDYPGDEIEKEYACEQKQAA